jgi:hypothetical protein
LAINLLYFSNPKDFEGYVIQEIADAKKTILSYSEKLNTASKRYESLPKGDGKKKSKWTGGGGSDILGNTKQQEVEGFKILVNPTPNYELSILDEAIRSVQERLEALEKIEKHLMPNLRDHPNITAIFDDGIPVAFMYGEEKH